MSENVSNNAAPKRPAVRETVSRKAREAQESAKASASLATNTAKSATSTATSKATDLFNTMSGKLPFDLPKIDVPNVDISAHVAKVTEKSTQLAGDAKKTVESTVTLVREAVGK